MQHCLRFACRIASEGEIEVLLGHVDLMGLFSDEADEPVLAFGCLSQVEGEDIDVNRLIVLALVEEDLTEGGVDLLAAIEQEGGG